MKRARRIRRLPKYGWSIETDSGEVSAIKRDDGTRLSLAHRLMATREAARSVGVQPSNFVRDWASRPDFPAPLATLSSGRIWLGSDVEQYAATRRAPKPGEERIAQIARRIAWWQSREKTLARPLDFVGRVMASGSMDEIRDVEEFFGRRVLCQALENASPGVFDRRSWNYWHLVLGLERSVPLPVRHVP